MVGKSTSGNKSKKINKTKKIPKKISQLKGKTNKHTDDDIFLKSVLNNLDIGIYITQNKKFVYVNPRFEKISGYVASHLIGKYLSDFVHPEDKERIRPLTINILKGVVTEPYEYRLICEKGKIISIIEIISSITFNNKQAVLGISLDITEHKRVESLLNESEEKYRAIIENIKDGYFEIDLSGNFTFFNDALREIHGYPKNELMGMGNRQYTDKENAKKVFETFQTIYKTGKSGSLFDYEIIRKDGTKKQIEVSASLKKDSSGNPIGFRGITRDITERKQAEDVIRHSEERYRTILDEMDEGYFEVDLAGNYTFFNEAICRHLGYSREELLGLNFRVPIAEKDIEVLHKAFSNIYLTGKPERGISYTAVRKNGTTAFAEITGFPLRNRKGEIIGFRGIAYDITNRKHLEEALRQSEERYRTILDESDVLYYELDLFGHFTFVNNASCRKLGLSREEIIGVNSLNHMLKEDAEKMRKYFINIYKTGKPEKSMIYRVKRNDGSIITIENTGFPLRNEKGEIVGFRGVSRDITEQIIMQETLRQSEERYRTILEEMEEAYFEVDLAGNYTYINDANCRIMQYSKEEILGKNFRLGMSDNDYMLIYNIFSNIYATGKPQKNIFFKAIRKDGTTGFAELTGFPLKNEKGETIGFRGIGFDITERKLMEEALRQSEERYRTIIEEMEEWYFETDLAGNINFFNSIFAKILGYSQNELTGLNFRSFIIKDEIDSVYRIFNKVYKTGEPEINFPYDFIEATGSVVSAEFSIFPLRNQEGKVIGFRGVGRDITERKKNEEKIKYIATHDSLTGLPNRIMFGQILNHAIESAKRYNRQLAVFFIDLDRFKIINDTLGHDAGDKLLREISIRFRQTLRAMDVVARLGGDEFVVMIEEINDVGQATIVAHKLLAAAMKPVSLMSQECRVTASIGVSIYPKDGDDEQSLMKNADIAMYFAKEEGKNNFQLYSADIKPQSVERLSLETQLRFALERNELSLAYQAKLDFKTGAITGVEALLRWNNPKLGQVTPIQFIPVAEETGLIVPIGRWVYKTACMQNVAWQNNGLPPVCMAVNLSLRQLVDENLIEDIEKALKDSGMAPELLELEITESMVMHNPGRMIAVLAKIKALGVRLAIDDFGTGYSSLAQIKHFPVDTLKVDRSFIRNIMDNTEDRAIAEAIISMGKTLSLTVVAEGVETEEQMDFLRGRSCDEMQGFYFSKPIPPEEFASLLGRHVPSTTFK